MHHGYPARNFRSEDDYGPGWRQSRRDSINDDVAPDDVSLLGPPTIGARRQQQGNWAPDARFAHRRRSEEELASYGYAGQGYPIFGQAGRASYEDPQPGWFADPVSSAYAFGYTTSVRSLDPFPGSGLPGQGGPPSQSGHAGKGPRDYLRADTRVLEDVCDLLSDDDEVDASDIGVAVASGEVTLTGTVLDRYTKRRAEHLAASVRGVVDVQNRLRVNKGLLRELGDEVTGSAERDHHGHHGSGTRADPSAG
jgi:osmotically-inducible protein OsmY